MQIYQRNFKKEENQSKKKEKKKNNKTEEKGNVPKKIAQTTPRRDIKKKNSWN